MRQVCCRQLWASAATPSGCSARQDEAKRPKHKVLSTASLQVFPEWRIEIAMP
jgi:hypothetical protein